MELKTVLIVLLLAGVGWLAYDNRGKRAALVQAQSEVQRVNSAPAPVPQVLAALPSRAVAPVPAAAPPSTPPAWFQDRLRERPALEVAAPNKNRRVEAQQQYPNSTPTPLPLATPH